MKRIIVLLPLALLAFRTENKTASLSFTKDQYQGVQSRLVDAMRTIDSLKIILHYNDVSSKVDQSAMRAQQDLVDVYNFVGQVDSVFKPEMKAEGASGKIQK